MTVNIIYYRSYRTWKKRCRWARRQSFLVALPFNHHKIPSHHQYDHDDNDDEAFTRRTTQRPMMILIIPFSSALPPSFHTAGMARWRWSTSGWGGAGVAWWWGGRRRRRGWWSVCWAWRTIAWRIRYLSIYLYVELCMYWPVPLPLRITDSLSFGGGAGGGGGSSELQSRGFLQARSVNLSQSVRNDITRSEKSLERRSTHTGRDERATTEQVGR